ncbi:hypothetical protein PR048_022822 [Dryococelus australis]|uniref:Uncharacterized protein n=1 Tax=Dryococelus australis TaxID=614101 RepID=A0ABQ9GSD4_9NEOP|nr:hypothetical protein PR048_022822 [Dryococelus australis]
MEAPRCQPSHLGQRSRLHHWWVLGRNFNHVNSHATRCIRWRHHTIFLVIKCTREAVGNPIVDPLNILPTLFMLPGADSRRRLKTAGRTHLHFFLVRCPDGKRRRYQCQFAIPLPPPLNPHPAILSGDRGADGFCRLVRCPSRQWAYTPWDTLQAPGRPAHVPCRVMQQADRRLCSRSRQCETGVGTIPFALLPCQNPTQHGVFVRAAGATRIDTPPGFKSCVFRTHTTTHARAGRDSGVGQGEGKVVVERGEVVAPACENDTTPTFRTLQSAPFGQQIQNTAGRGGWIISTLASRQGEPGSIPGRVTGFSKWESCRTMPLVGGSSPGSPASRAPPPPNSGAAPYSLQSPSSALKTEISSLTHLLGYTKKPMFSLFLFIILVHETL